MKNKLEIIYCSANEGKTLWIKSDSKETIRILQQIFAKLAEKEQTAYKLEKYVQFVHDTMVMFQVISCSSEEEGYISVEETDEECLKIIWVNKPDEWEWFSELTASIIRSQVACHQYLSRYMRDDDILIKLSYEEV
jgi:hypothetical protein